MGTNYPNFRSYGNPPYEIVLVHGGPGAPGEMAPLAEKLSDIKGTLEPLQKASSIEGQILELHQEISKNCTTPITLIEWSWGAMLSFIFAARYPSHVKKLILISSGPFESSYAESIMPTRLARLSKATKMEMEKLIESLNDPNIDKTPYLKKFAEIIFQADAYNPTTQASTPLEYQYELHQKVWNEVKELRNNRQLLAFGQSISCPVVAIHGDHDPHPFSGIKEPLSKIIENFRFILIKNCGHYPWYEKEASEEFYQVLQKEILS